MLYIGEYLPLNDFGSRCVCDNPQSSNIHELLLLTYTHIPRITRTNSSVAGVRLQDYRGPDVTAENFLSILSGQEPSVIGSSGKVIKSGPNDRVFVFYADHGAPGARQLRTHSPVIPSSTSHVLSAARCHHTHFEQHQHA